MKRIVLLLLLLFTCMFIFACGGDDNDRQVIEVLVEGTSGYTQGTKLKTVLDELKADPTSNFTYESENGPYGEQILSINGVASNPSKKQAWLIYKSSKADSYEEFTYVYQGKTFYSAAYGISSLAISNGEQFLFVFSTY